MNRVKDFLKLFVEAAQAWSEDRVSLYAAAIAYYTVFSLAPVLSLSIGIAGFFLGRSAVRDEVVARVMDFAGPEVANFIAGLLTNVVQGASEATLISIGLVLFAASGVFGQLIRALDLIYGVIPKPQPGLEGALVFVKTRAVALGMVFLMGLLLLGALLMSTALAFLSNTLSDFLPSVAGILPSVNRIVSPVVICLLFLLVFKTLTHARLRWRDALVGALVATVLFLLGVYLINLYLNISNPASVYGAAGSVIVVLLWIYYSAQIMLYGAEFTKVFANSFGQQIKPDDDAMYLAERLMERNEHSGIPQRLPEPEPHPLPPPALETAVPPPASTHQTRKQAAAGLLGLAIGLLIGYVGNLRDRG